MSKRQWLPQEIARLTELHHAGTKLWAIAVALDRPFGSVGTKVASLTLAGVLHARKVGRPRTRLEGAT